MKIESFNPNSENTQTSSSVAPKQTKATCVVPEVGCVILAVKSEFLEYTRTLSVDPISMRSDDLDHKNQWIDTASSGGRDITRDISKLRVSLMVSFEGMMVAMQEPSGLGSD